MAAFTPETSAQWWTEDKAKTRAESVSRNIGQIKQAQLWRRDAWTRFARLYSNVPIVGLGVHSVNRPTSASSTRLALNVIKNCSDAFVSKLAKEKPKVSFLTSGGDWDLQEKAKDLEKFLEGLFYDSKVYDQNPQIVLDACIFGTGVYKVYADLSDEEHPRAVCERVAPWEFYVDEQEGMYGNPRNLYQRKYIDRGVLIAQFPEHEEELRKQPRQTDDPDSVGHDTTSDQIVVWEAWHLPSGHKAEDGRHVICTRDVTLLDEPWEKPYFPFVFYRRQSAPFGFWGIGVAEELLGLQLEINVLLQKIQRSHHLLAAGHWLVEQGAKVTSGNIDNEIGSIIRYAGTPPQLVVGQAVSQEVYAHLWQLYSKAYEITGISQLSATGQKPSGDISGVALETLADVQSERFAAAQMNYHAMHLELARQLKDVSSEIAEKFPKFSVKSVSKTAATKVRFLDVDLRDEEVVLRMYPTNALADDPARRMAQVQGFAQAGWVDVSDAKRLLDFPDLEADSDLRNASYNLVQDIIQAALKDGKYIGPEPFMDLKDAINRVQLAYLNAKRRGVSDERLQLLRDWMQAADQMAHPPPSPDQQMPAGPPPGPPAPPPAGPGGGPPAAMPPPEGMMQ